MTHPLFIGCGTALVTPFRDGEVDREAYIHLVRSQLAAGVDALIVAGTTGESPTLTDREKQWLFSTTVREVQAFESRRLAGENSRHVPVIAGTGSNNTARAIDLSRMAADCGCDGLLVVTPYYNKASEAGLLAHYTAIADATDRPVIVYHVPSRTGCPLSPATCARLATHPRIVGLKDATGDLSFTARVRANCGDDLPVYAGNDDQTLPILSLGGLGVISVVSNLYPTRMTRLCRLAREGNFPAATREQLSLIPLCDALFCQVNPIPVKAALALRGVCSDEVRLPLATADERVRQRLQTAMTEMGEDT